MTRLLEFLAGGGLSALTRELLSSPGLSVTHVSSAEAALGVDLTQDVR